MILTTLLTKSGLSNIFNICTQHNFHHLFMSPFLILRFELFLALRCRNHIQKVILLALADSSTKDDILPIYQVAHHLL